MTSLSAEDAELEAYSPVETHDGLRFELDPVGYWTPIWVAKDRLSSLAMEVQELREALKDLSDMYTHAWDLESGGLIMMGSSIPRFEKAHKRAAKLLAPRPAGEATE